MKKVTITSSNSTFSHIPYHIGELLADQGHDERRLPNFGCWQTKRQVCNRGRSSRRSQPKWITEAFRSHRVGWIYHLECKGLMDRRVLKRWWNYSALIKSNEKKTSARLSFTKTVCQHHAAGGITECLNLRRIYWRQSYCAYFYGIFTYALPLIISSRLCAFSPALTNWVNWVDWDWCNIYAPVGMKDAASRLSLASFPCYVRIGAWVFANSVQSLASKLQVA